MLDLANIANSWLFVVVCPLLDFRNLPSKLKRLPKINKILSGILTLVPTTKTKNTTQVWHSPTMGLLFMWCGKYAHCTNKIGCRSHNTSLLFVFTFNPKSKYMAGGAVLDPTKLSTTFYNVLLQCHTNLGDVVVDLCSRSSVLAYHTFCVCCSVLAVEQDENHSHWICNHLWSAEYASSLLNTNLGGDSINKFSFAELKFYETPNSTNSVVGETDLSLCACCGKGFKIKDTKILCIHSKCEIHEWCASLAGNNEGCFLCCSKNSYTVSPFFAFFVLCLYHAFTT